MNDGLYDRDRSVVSSAEHLRFFPLNVVEGRGARLVDETGRELIDLSGGWSAAGVGYANPRVVAAVTESVRVMPGVSVLSGTHRYGVELAERLADLIPIRAEERSIYLGLAGSDANAAVLRSIRAWSDRPRLLAFEHSYHGGLGPAQHVSGLYTAAGTSADPGLVLAPYGETSAVADTLAAGDVAAVLVEPILSDGGLVIPPPEFLPGLRELCDRTGTLLVIDEVKVGLGRTGQLLAHQADGVVADVVTLGKSLGGGLSLSAAIGPRSVMNAAPASTLLTTAGNPVACAAGLAVLDALIDDGLVERAAAMGPVLTDALRQLETGHPLVADVRSRGLVGGIELREPDGSPATAATAKVVFRAHQLGVVAYYVGPDSNVIELTPPLVIAEADLQHGIELIGRAIDDVAAGLVSDADVAPYAGW